MPKQTRDVVTIIIPARNEQECIIDTLSSVVKKVRVPYRIVVIDDCSIDNTYKLVKKFIKRHPQISVVKNSITTPGFANAIKLGLSKVRSSLIVMMMADLCDDQGSVNQMYRKIQQGYNVVCGSRYMLGGQKIGGPKLQNLLSSLVCRTLFLVTGVPTKDISNCFKMYQTEILRNAVFNPDSGVETAMEVVFQLYFDGAKIIDIPTIWQGRKAGKSKFKLIQRAPKYLKIY